MVEGCGLLLFSKAGFCRYTLSRNSVTALGCSASGAVLAGSGRDPPAGHCSCGHMDRGASHRKAFGDSKLGRKEQAGKGEEKNS